MKRKQPLDHGSDRSRTTEKEHPAPSSLRVNRRDALGVAAAMLAGGVATKARATSDSTLAEVLNRRKTGDSHYKATAIADYNANMAAFGGQLCAPVDRLLRPIARRSPTQFDVLVVGSGYGASVCAARLAAALRPGCRLGVLERGKEWIPGTFPDRLKDVTDQSRLELLGPRKGETHDPTGLYNVQQFEETTILSGCGLGGSSLINASVAIRPDREVFQQPMWPVRLRDRIYLDAYYELAAAELGARVEPLDASTKMAAQRMAAQRLAYRGARFEPAAITVTRVNTTNGLPVLNRQGVHQRNCIDCGDCLTGCNVGAKNTLAMNYLPMARRGGAEMFTQTEVHRIEKRPDGHYVVHFSFSFPLGEGKFERVAGCTTTRVLILAAGSLGSTEILLRSQSDCLTLSPYLGLGWTGNGDALGFITNSQCPTGVAGKSAYSVACPPIGPTIQSNINYPHRPLPGRVLIQEGAAARAYANAIGALMLDLKMENTQILLGMGHDGAAGRIALDDNGFGEVRWPGLLDSDYRKLIRHEFEQVAVALGGNYRFLRIFGDRMISVHPLGGCGMSDDPRCGVVNDKGQVFDAHNGGDQDSQTGEARVHSGLYVVDGAILPTSIACNPFLTITALAERACDLILNEPCYQDLFATA